MLFSRFESVLDTHTPTPCQIVLAFSGGLDSRVMLDLLSTYRDVNPRHRYLVIHVHHGLSPNADAWLDWCEKQSKEAGFAFQGMKVSLEPNGDSLEQAARKARYKAIKQCIEPGAVVLTGQHHDDQVETFFLALKRGSGPAGLAAMPEIRPFAEGWLVRPLLAISRADIESYGKQQGLGWLEDESNTDRRFDRNFLRHDWLPVAKNRWPGLPKAVARSAHLCAEQELLLDELLEGYDHQVIMPGGELSISGLAPLSGRLANAMIRRWLKRHGGLSVTMAQLDQILHSVIDAADDANPKLELGKWQIRRHRDYVYVLPQLQDVSGWSATLEPGGNIELPDKLGTLSLIETSLEAAAIKAALYDRESQMAGSTVFGLRALHDDEAVTVSFDPMGHFARPLGRQGKRKLKKLFQEYGVPAWERRRRPIVFYGDEVAAVAGLFVCRGFDGQDCELVWHKSN